mgnify:CR=1 FL=1
MTLHYWWWAAAFVLIAAEMIAPGFFLLWIGLAAAAMGFITWLAPDIGALPQAVIFAVLALASCVVYWRWFRHAGDRVDPDNANLNRRGAQHVGKRYVLDTPIQNGRGKARVGDSYWIVEGPDLPAGTEVEVVAVDGASLRVRAAG